jgi:hypothetical protein
LMKPLVGRGAAYADIDADGDLDVLITGIAERARLLRNDQKLGRHWLRLKLVGAASNRDAIGALVEVKLQDRVLRRRVSATRSYLSQTELPLSFGLGESMKVDSVSIRWPDGSKQDVAVDGVDRLVEVAQAPQSLAAGVQPSTDDVNRLVEGAP